MKKIRRTRIIVRTGRLFIAQDEADAQGNNRPTTEPQMCPLCRQLIKPNQSLNLLAACAGEHAKTNEKEE